MTIIPLTDTRIIRLMPLAIGFLGVFSFFAALIWEYVGGAIPCVMCSLERWGFLIAGLLGFGAFQFKKTTTLQRFLGVLAFLFAALTVILFRHMGIQYKWFKLPGICRASQPISSFELSEQLLTTIPQMTCDQIEFTVLGQPPTFFLFLLTMGLTIICFWGFLKESRACSSAALP